MDFSTNKLKQNTLLTGLDRHDLLVQLVRQREDDLMRTTLRGMYGPDVVEEKVLDADAVATLIEEVLELASD